MPNIKSAIKRVSVIEKKTLRNNMIKSEYKTAIKKFEKGKTYIIKANQVFSDNELVSFDCFIYNDDIECAKATVNVFQPKDDETDAI